jgi:transposase
MKHVQGWVGARIETLTRLLSEPVRELDFSDDRLALVLKALSRDRRWDGFEAALNGQLLRVYDLKARCVRLDATTAKGYFTVSEEGLFQFGHSKDHRPDLPQIKIMVSVLDPMGLPLTVEVVSGERADDPLYIPAAERVRRQLGRSGLLYVGDCKMAALQTRSFLAAGGDYYLCPLPGTSQTEEILSSGLEPLWRSAHEPTAIYRRLDVGPGAIERALQEEQAEPIAEGLERSAKVVGTWAGHEVSFTERQLLVRSLSQAQAQGEALDKRLRQALEAIAALSGRGRKRLRLRAEAEQAVGAILQRYDVGGLVSVHYKEDVHWREVRAYGESPQRLRAERQVDITAEVDAEAVALARRRLGWRVYVTNAPAEHLPLAQAVLAYREQYRVEHPMARLKGHPLSLSPLYVQREDHVKGLVRLLSLGLRALVLLEHQVREQLAERGERLAGLDLARRRWETGRPTAERLLKAFENITQTRIEAAGQRIVHVTPLSEVQLRILSLLGLSSGLYLQAGPQSAQPP